jgi:hypothetical protein
MYVNKNAKRNSMGAPYIDGQYPCTVHCVWMAKEDPSALGLWGD